MSQPFSVIKSLFLLTAYVVLSSVLGLMGSDTGGVASRFRENFVPNVWSVSPIADVVFVLGTAIAGVWAFRLAEKRKFFGSVAGAFALNWVVYWASFMILSTPSSPSGGAGPDPVAAFRFVGDWGFIGLIFASLAPAVAAVYTSGSQPQPARPA